MPKTFTEILNDFKAQLDGFIQKDTPTEQITKIGELKSQCDELETAHKQTLDDYAELKDRYIDAVKSYGTGKAPSDDINDSQKEVSLEEIGAKIISQRGKTK